MPRKSLAAALAAAVLTTLAVSAPTSAASATPCAEAPIEPATTRAVFNNPMTGQGDALVQQLCGLIRQTPPGARIRVAHFVMSGTAGTQFADELVKAHKRDVDVQVIVDGDTRGGAVAARLAAELGGDTAARSYLHVCSGPVSGGTAACIGDKGQHNKFYLFSRAGHASDVVVQSSANLTDLNSTTYWNNAVILPRNQRLSAAYNSYFEDLAAEKKNLDYYRVVQTGTAGGSVRAHFFPRAGADASTDPIVESLSEVSCAGGTKIRVGMSEWDAYRLAIAQRLARLSAQGCPVQIVYGIMDDEVRQVLQGAPGIELRTLGDGSALPGRIHSKYLLVEGTYGGDGDARWVFTGSHNFNETSLRRNDETLLRLNDRGVYQQYVTNFEAMRAAAPLATAP
ncbi:phospholipase D-like domain-containing protein [Streptosporangium soli]|nr:phospholipase D-like domain-containing protein [Streptosporangium sp. KLBMP 9127]